MAEKTQIPIGSAQAIVPQSVGLFHSNLARETTMNRLTGPMPKEATARAGIKKQVQSSPDYPIVKAVNLEKGAGDEVIFDFIQPMNMIPIMDDAYAEGNGVKMDFTDDRLRIGQYRLPVNVGSQMTRQRTVYDLRKMAKVQCHDMVNRLTDQLPLVHMAGARGFHNNINWMVPTNAHADFNKIMINTVRAPSRNRHFMADGTNGITPITDTAGVMDIASTDLFGESVVDAIRAWRDESVISLKPVKFMGDKHAADSPLNVLLCSPLQYTSFAATANFRSYQAQAMARANQAGQNPLFTGEVGLWNNILIVKMPYPIRFFSGDTLNYCASKTSQTETSITIPAALGAAGYAVDRAILLGGQAVAEAMGGYRITGSPFYWKEKETDFDDKMEVAVGTMRGCSKIQWLIDHGPQREWTDNGVCVFDTAVKLTAN